MIEDILSRVTPIKGRNGGNIYTVDGQVIYQIAKDDLDALIAEICRLREANSRSTYILERVIDYIGDPEITALVKARPETEEKKDD